MKNAISIYGSAAQFASSSSATLCICAVLWITGCAPKVARVELPFNTPDTFSFSGTAEPEARWWQAFNDGELNRLVDTALHTNLSLVAVWHQFQEARALVAISSSEKIPDIYIELQSGISRPEPDFVGGENTQLSLGADYEVDLWGRIRHSIHAEEFRFKASYHDYKTAAISLSGEIVLIVFRIKATKQHLQLADEQLKTNEQVLSLIRARFAGGQVKGVDILRQEQLIENTKALKTDFELQLELFRHQLSVLLGRPPADLPALEAPLPELPPLPQTGIPLQLVNRRPDVQSAFFRLQAADREVAAAISNKYPRLNLSLYTAIRSNTFDNLFQSQAVALTAGLLAPVFFGGRLNAELDQARAVRQQLLHDYGQTVLTAFQEVENALIRETKQQESIEAIENQITLADKTLDQLKIEYLNGSIAYLDVLVTLNEQQQLRRDLLSARTELLENRIALYRALAGDFETGREDFSSAETKPGKGSN